MLFISQIKKFQNQENQILYWFGAIFSFLWPLLYLNHYVIHSDNNAIAIGNDFNHLYYAYKPYLLDALIHFKLPLWSPGEAAGFPFYANPFTQSFYPLNLIFAIQYKANGGLSLADYHTFTVIGVSIFSLGIYLWLMSIKSNLRSVLFAVLIIGVSFKITELLRFPNAVHTAAWFPFILWGITEAAKSKYVKSTIIIVLSVIMLVTGGYPYYVYYSVFLIGPYIIILWWKKSRESLDLDLNFSSKKYLLTIVTAFVLALIIVAPYLIKIQDLMAQTTDRGGSDYSYSTIHEFYVLDTLGSLLFPPQAQAEGWYYFGIVGLLMLMLSATYTFMKNESKNKFFFAIIFTWFAIITYISYGKHSYLFDLMWQYLPGFSSLRVWGRLNIILLPVIALALQKSFGIFESLIYQPTKPSLNIQETKKTGRQRPQKITKAVNYNYLNNILILTLVFMLIIIIQYILLKRNIYNVYWDQYFKPFFPEFNPNFYLLMSVLSYFVILSILAIMPKLKKVKISFMWIVLTILVFISSIDTGKVGRYQWAYSVAPDRARKLIDIDTLNKEAFSSPRTNYGGFLPLKNFSTGIMPNWYFARYVKFLNEKRDSLDANGIPVLLGGTDGRRIFFTDSLNYTKHPIYDFLISAYENEKSGIVHYKIIQYTGDYLKIELETKKPGHFNFIDNWDKYWNAYSNGVKTNIDLAFGTFKSVEITKAGKYTIEFRYQPRLF